MIAMQKMPGAFLLLFLINALSLCTIGSSHAFSSIARRATSPATSPSARLLQETDEITKANWQQHPKIKAIRAIVQSVKMGLSSKSFTIKKRAFEYCEPYEDTARTVATDSK